MHKPNLNIETERLIIRPFTLADIEPSYVMNLDEEVSKYTGDGGVASKSEIERRIKENVLGDYKRHGFGRLAVELKENGEFIGFAGLKYLEDLKEVDLGYRFLSDYWGKGYATESSKACLEFGFTNLGLEKIIAMVFPDNAASVHVLDKLNFKFEKDIIEDGEKVDVYALKRENYKKGLDDR